MQLFEDWCEATGRSPADATPEALSAFFEDVPCAGSTQQSRMRALRRYLRENYGVDVEGTSRYVEGAWRRGVGWEEDPEVVLARMPVAGWPFALRGRRDAWLVVLIGVLGMTRSAAIVVGADDVVADGRTVVVAGRSVRVAADPRGCPACAVTRWARVLHLLDHHRSLAQSLLIRAAERPSEHDCRVRLDSGWGRGIWQMAPAIDRHGWHVDWRPMSKRAVSAVLACWQNSVWQPSQPAQEEDASDERIVFVKQIDSDRDWDDLYAELDDRAAAADEVLQRIEAALRSM